MNPVRFLAAVLVLLAAGCAATPQQRLANVERTVQVATDATRVLIESKALDDKPDVLRAIRVVNGRVRYAMAKARLFVAGGSEADANYWIDQALAGLAEWATYNAQGEGKR